MTNKTTKAYAYGDCRGCGKSYSTYAEVAAGKEGSHTRCPRCGTTNWHTEYAASRALIDSGGTSGESEGPADD